MCFLSLHHRRRKWSRRPKNSGADTLGRVETGGSDAYALHSLISYFRLNFSCSSPLSSLFLAINISDIFEGSAQPTGNLISEAHLNITFSSHTYMSFFTIHLYCYISNWFKNTLGVEKNVIIPDI